MSKSRESSIFNKKTKEQLSYDLKGRIDKHGKLLLNWRNVLFPNQIVNKIFVLMETKTGIDSILKYCSEIEKIKKFLFDEEHLFLFNNLPDVEFDEFLNPSKPKDKAEKLEKLLSTNPESKMVKMMTTGTKGTEGIN